MTHRFRILVVLALCFHFVGLFVLPQIPYLFSADTIELMKYSGHGAHIAVYHPAMYVLYLLPYPALIALYFFRNWGRYLLLAFICLTLFGTFFFGASVSGPPESFVSFAATLLDGAILALVFLAPLQQCFSTSISCSGTNARVP